MSTVRKLGDRSPQRLTPMKTAKSTSSPVHSKRTDMEHDNKMRTKSIHTILGLDVQGTLMRMDEEGICHITIAHPDPGYCDRAINYLQKLHIQGHKLDWEGDTIALTSIRLTQRDHPSVQQELKIHDRCQFPDFNGKDMSTKHTLPSQFEPEIEIGNSDGSASSNASSSTHEVKSDVIRDHKEDTLFDDEMSGDYNDLVDTDDEETQPNGLKTGQPLISDFVERNQKLKKPKPFAAYPPFQQTDKLISELTQLCDDSKANDSNLTPINVNGQPSATTTTAHEPAVSFQDKAVTREDLDSTSSSKTSLASPTSSRDSTVIDIDTGTATVFQKKSTAHTKASDKGQWVKYQKQPPHANYDVNQRDEALEEAFETYEDDVNTISSDQTSHYKNHEEANKEEPPVSIRYQLGFQIDDDDLTTLLQDFAETEDNNEIIPDTLSKTKALVSSFFNQAKSLDNGFAVISWADASTFEMIKSVKDIPADTVNFASFFKGFRPRQTTGRMYLRIRLHAPSIGHLALLAGMTEWSQLSGCTFYKTVIQAENATSIGWLVYSSQHSNLDSLLSYLAVKTGYEWGAKLGACTESDAMTTDPETDEPIRAQWKDRTKALFLYVPHDKAMEAKTVISDLMEINSSTVNKQIPSLSDKFLFMHPERQMSDEPSKVYYQQIVSKQVSHTRHIQISIANIFDQSIDQPVLTRDGNYISLRQLVLSIRVSNKSSDFYQASLFHGLDYTDNSKKIYINGLPGPGGPAYIFSYYAPMAADAEEMLQGLGIYAGRLYGNRTMNPCFTTSHWNGNKGWKWDKSSGRFLTPASRQREANIKFDPNLAIEKLAKMDSLTITPKPIKVTAKPEQGSKTKLKKKRGRKHKKKTQDKDKDDDSATLMDPLKVKETALLRRVIDHDEDSQIQSKSAGHVKKKDVTQVIIPSQDEISIASTLTMGSIVDQRMTSEGMDNPSASSSINSKNTSTSSLKSVSNPEYFESMLKEGMTADEIRQRASTFYKHQINKAHNEHQRALESFLSSVPATNTTVVTPHKPKLTGSLDAGKES